MRVGMKIHFELLIKKSFDVDSALPEKYFRSTTEALKRFRAKEKSMTRHEFGQICRTNCKTVACLMEICFFRMLAASKLFCQNKKQK